MYIEPNSRIVLLADVPLNPKQEDTYYFGSNTEQFNTLYKRRIAEFNRQSYTRVERGRIRVEITADKVYSCNYLMFQNSAYGNKWFYAFVTACEYVNDVTTEITFVLDEIQTWFFEHDVPPCFVERQHSSTDAVGDNIEPEPVTPGDLVPNDYIPIHHTYAWPGANDRMIVVSWIDPLTDIGDINNWMQKGQLINGTFTTGELHIYNGDDPQQVAECSKWIKEQMQEHPESIIAMYMSPRWAVGRIQQGDWFNASYTLRGQKYTFQLPPLMPLGDLFSNKPGLQGYVPKNNKMYTYPYNMLQVVGGSGNSIGCRYEFFNNFTPTFEETWNLLEPVSAALRPTNYRGIADSSKDIVATLDGFPMCMWSGDAYKAWVAQNSVDIGSSIIKGLGSFIMGTLATGSPIGGLVVGAVSSFNAITGAISQAHKASIAADVTGGNATGSNTWAHDMLDFYAMRMSCDRDNAKAIDSFFTAFGYAQNAVFKPRLHARRYFTYVKTVGAVITGALPADSKQAIAGYYDNGIRFWTADAPFGNLSINNPTL